jgi:hypothetical protein
MPTRSDRYSKVQERIAHDPYGPSFTRHLRPTEEVAGNTQSSLFTRLPLRGLLGNRASAVCSEAALTQFRGN